MNLTDLKVLDIAVVKKINLKGKTLKKLKDFGVVEGTKIQLIKKSAFKGALAVYCRDFVFAIRYIDAMKIEVGII